MPLYAMHLLSMQDCRPCPDSLHALKIQLRRKQKVPTIHRNEMQKEIKSNSFLQIVKVSRPNVGQIVPPCTA